MGNFIKKVLVIISIFTMTLAVKITPSFAFTSLTDISNSYAKDAINELVDAGILNGVGNGQFNPTGKITRQDFAIILAKSLNLDTEQTPPTATFSDVPASHYSYKFVEAAAKAELILGTGDGEFGFGANLTRQDMAVLFVRALGVDIGGFGKNLTFSDSNSIADYAKDAVGYSVEAGLLNGIGNNSFNPSGAAARQHVALVTSKFMKVREELPKQKPTPEPVQTLEPVPMTETEQPEIDAPDLPESEDPTPPEDGDPNSPESDDSNPPEGDNPTAPESDGSNRQDEQGPGVEPVNLID